MLQSTYIHVPSLPAILTPYSLLHPRRLRTTPTNTSTQPMSTTCAKLAPRNPFTWPADDRRLTNEAEALYRAESQPSHFSQSKTCQHPSWTTRLEPADAECTGDKDRMTCDAIQPRSLRPTGTCANAQRKNKRQDVPSYERQFTGHMFHRHRPRPSRTKAVDDFCGSPALCPLVRQLGL